MGSFFGSSDEKVFNANENVFREYFVKILKMYEEKISILQLGNFLVEVFYQNI